MSANPFMQRSMHWWNVAFLLIFATVGVSTMFDDLRLLEKAGVLAALAVLVAGYLLFVRHRLLADRRSGSLPVAGYLLLLYVLSLLIMAVSGIGGLLFFVAFTSTWMLLPLRWAIAGSVTLTAGIVATIVALSGWSPQAWSTGVMIGGGTAASGILLGLWITGLVSESERRRHLIAELERTRTELGEAQRRAGAFAERERLAAEIHDTITQGLLSIVVHTRAIESGDPELDGRIRRIERIAEENLAEARGLIEALQPAELREHSLADALGRVCERFGGETGVRISLRIESEPRMLDANTEVVLLRAAQEALTNVRKHASADSVDVLLAYTSAGSADTAAAAEDAADGDVRLVVTDDGVGFRVPDAESGSWGGLAGTSGHRAGLRGIQNRAEQINGRVEVRSSPGTGTTISVEVPS